MLLGLSETTEGLWGNGNKLIGTLKRVTVHLPMDFAVKCNDCQKCALTEIWGFNSLSVFPRQMSNLSQSWVFLWSHSLYLHKLRRFLFLDLENNQLKNLGFGPFPWDCVYHLYARGWDFFFSSMEAVFHPCVLHMPFFGQGQTQICVISIICLYQTWMAT